MFGWKQAGISQDRLGTNRRTKENSETNGVLYSLLLLLSHAGSPGQLYEGLAAGRGLYHSRAAATRGRARLLRHLGRAPHCRHGWDARRVRSLRVQGLLVWRCGKRFVLCAFFAKTGSGQAQGPTLTKDAFFLSAEGCMASGNTASGSGAPPACMAKQAHVTLYVHS